MSSSTRRCSTREPPSPRPSATCSACTGCCRRMSARSTSRWRAGSRCCARSRPISSAMPFLRDLQDTNETLFYALLVRNIEEMLPLVYTPTVGEGCQRFSEIWRKPRGVFLSYPNQHRIRRDPGRPALRPGPRHRGDATASEFSASATRAPAAWASPIGKLSLYTGCAGIPSGRDAAGPARCRAPTTSERLDDPIYIGWRHARVAGADYDGVRRGVRRRGHRTLASRPAAMGGFRRLPTPRRCWRAIATGSAPSTTTSRAPPPSPPATLMAAINVTGVPLTRAAHRAAGRRLGRMRHRRACCCGR